MLRPQDLSALPDFTLGRLSISPARRHVACGDQDVAVEPRIMQVLVLLAREPGSVVSRTQLVDEIWAVPVGDDSINRAVAGVRRVLALDPALGLETIPRTGYRLTGMDDPQDGAASANSGMTLSRRSVGISLGAAAALGGLGYWSHRQNNRTQFDALIAKGREALDYGDAPLDPLPPLRKAVQLRPDDAMAVGLLAYALTWRSGLFNQPENSSRVEAEELAARALAIDPRQSDARLTQAILDRSNLDFAAAEDRYLAILRDDPRHAATMQSYWRLLQCVGRSKAGLAWVERALAVAPQAASFHFPRAQFLWILGQNAQADRVIDQAYASWPNHNGVRFARFILLAFTGRARAARAMIDDPRTAPSDYSPADIALWRTSLTALELRTPDALRTARNANVQAASANLKQTAQAVMTLSALNQVDAAFELVDRLFVVGKESSSKPAPVSSIAWRFAPWLFVPPLAAMRADPRFGRLCEAIGLVDYWGARHLRPDFPIAGA